MTWACKDWLIRILSSKIIYEQYNNDIAILGNTVIGYNFKSQDKIGYTYWV